MAITSLYAGICIAKTKTSVCHSISYPITSNFGVPHGLACVFTMNSVTNFIYQDKTDKAKEIKQKVEKIWKSENQKSFQETINDFALKIDISNRVKKYINNYQELSAISNQMYTPDRMDNFILPIGFDQIKIILKNSW